MCPKIGYLGFWGWRCENIVVWSQEALPCVNTRLMVYRVSKSVQRPELQVDRKILRTKKEINKKNWVVTVAIWVEVTLEAILTKCGLWGDMVDVITCAIFRDCRLRGVVGVVRGVSCLLPLTWRVALTTLVTLPCDRVMYTSWRWRQPWRFRASWWQRLSELTWELVYRIPDVICWTW